jgi:deoxyribodipyrimidine photo-lyase
LSPGDIYQNATMKPKVQVVWFKRDLRLADHQPLHAAAQRGAVLALVMVEPGYWQLPDTSQRQWAYWRACVDDLSAALAANGATLVVRTGKALDILVSLRAEIGDFDLHAHMETGNDWTYGRDTAVHRWCRTTGTVFTEYAQFGVLRGPDVQRDRWATHWDRMMAKPVWPLPAHVRWHPANSAVLPDAATPVLPDCGLQRRQVPGRAAALRTLASFLTVRGQAYTREMSSPVTAEQACSRLSVHLAYGSLSMRETLQTAQTRLQELAAVAGPDAAQWRQSVRSFIARLHWHCHFIQKLESEPDAEYRPFARVYEGLRPRAADPEKLQAWADGKTGFPFVDAAMRYLTATGWINFRMRAMLMSFAAYDLWLPWQEAGLVLARRFLDYEPGIHWPQCQMQSGETGINTVRIYSPVKQSRDQDADGDFIRSWVPELANVPVEHIHEPWLMPVDQREILCPDYPLPVVDHKAASAEAKARIFNLRRKPSARSEADAVQTKHGSRKKTGKRFAPRSRVPKAAEHPAQLSLDI